MRNNNNAEFFWVALDSETQSKENSKYKVRDTWPFSKNVDIDVTKPEPQIAKAPFVDFRIPEIIRTNDRSVETDPTGRRQNEPGAKVDAGKIRTWLFISGFSRALEEVARVTTVGAVKYTPNGWAEVPNGSERYMDAFGRHLTAAGKGEIIDDGPKGTGCLHKAQMIWNLLASLELDLRKEQNERN